MARVSISEAARLTGKGRSTLYRHIEKGRISAEKDADGNPLIDTSELLRVYGPLVHETVSQQDSLVHHENPKFSNETGSLHREIEIRDERLATIERELRDRLADKDSVIDDLRRRLDAEAEERRKLTMLLTDQRRAEPKLLPVAPEKPAGGRLARAWAVLKGKG